MTFGDLTIDTASHTVQVAGEDVALAPKEFDLLVFLASNKGIALSREKILQKVWNYDYFGEDRTVDTPRQDAARSPGQMPQLHCHRVGHRLQVRPRRSAVNGGCAVHAANKAMPGAGLASAGS